mmetsp:Transcript_2424/g.1748  ORF Transcript_2424/g.1748 Transcript_2424/m.1748 type:complete len:113 (+) Transcript_2424:61-399(+)
MKESVIAVDEKDRQIWNMVTDVPTLKGIWPYICFILNIFLPGSGTMISSCFYEVWSKTQFLLGFFQLFLAYILVGWVWSVYWGYLLIKKSQQNTENEVQNFLANDELKSDAV